MITTEKDMNFLEEGDVFSVEHFKSMPAKNYPDRMMGKILTVDGVEIFTSAAKIVKILDELTKDDDITDLSRIEFTVIKAGTFNEKPILSLATDNKAVQKKIRIILF